MPSRGGRASDPSPSRGLRSIASLAPSTLLRPSASPPPLRVVYVAERGDAIAVVVTSEEGERLLYDVAMPARVEFVLWAGDAADGDCVVRTWILVAVEGGVWAGTVDEGGVGGRLLAVGERIVGGVVWEGGEVLVFGERGLGFSSCGGREFEDVGDGGGFRIEAAVEGGGRLVVGRAGSGERALGTVREGTVEVGRVVTVFGGGMAVSEGKVVDAAPVRGRGVVVLLWEGGRVSWVRVQDGVCARECARIEGVGGGRGACIRAMGGGGTVCVSSKGDERQKEEEEGGGGDVWSIRFEHGNFFKGAAVVGFHPGVAGCVVSEMGVVGVGKGGEVAKGPLWGEVEEGDVFRTVVGRLERRLRKGTNALVEDLVVAEEMEGIVGRARAVLGEVLEGQSGGPYVNVFQQELVEVLRPEGASGEKVSEDASQTRDPGVLLDAFVERDGGVVRVVEATHFVDAPGDFLYVAVDVIAVEFDHDGEEGTAVSGGDVALNLEVQLGSTFSLSWEATEWRGSVVSGVDDQKRRCRLLARTRLPSLVAASSVGLSALEAEVYVFCSDGRRQALGTFAVMPLVLAAGTASRRVMQPPAWAVDALRISFSERAQLVARGRGAELLRGCAKERKIVSGGASIDVRAATDVAVLSVEAPGVVAMAAAAAEIRESVGDETVVEISAGAGGRIPLLIDSVQRISRELNATRSFARCNASKGGADELACLFDSIAEADEALGLVEESFVATNLNAN